MAILPKAIYMFNAIPIKVRNESTWVITHVYMKAMVGIFLYSYP
jgi:hypothetical protein